MPAPSWLILLYTLPASQAAARLSLWRQLKRLGAVSLRTSAYILPQRTENEEALQWLAQRVQQEGGEATLLRSAEVDTLSPTDVIDLFQAARSEDYTTILAEARALKPARGNGQPVVRIDLAGEVERLRKRFLAVQQIDYFACPVAAKVREALEALAPAKRAKRKPVVKAIAYQGRCWQTRPRPELDRIASAWLIRRLIDPKATFLFATDRDPHPNTVTFDRVDADFGHEGDDCTFETLVRRFSLKAPGLNEIAQVVHAADLDDGRFPRTEGTGLLAVLRGWAKLGLPDEEILRRGFDLMDGLHQALTTH